MIMSNQGIFDSFETKTGVSIHVRSLTPQDAPFLVDLFENMGTESRYNRFLQSVDNVDMDRVWSEAEQIAQEFAADSYGLVALVDRPEREGMPAGAARYVKISPVRAEIAVSVRDDMQNMGIGTNLLQRLIIHAAEHGIEQLHGTVQNSNAAMWAMLSKLGHRLERQSEGSYSIITIHVRDSASRLEDWLDAAADFSPEPQIIW